MEDVKGQMAKGLSLDEAEQAVHANRNAAQKDDLLNQIAAKLGIGNSPQTATGTSANAADEAVSVFQEYSVDPNDPEAIPFLELRGADLVKAVSKLAIKRAKQSTPDSSEAPSITGNAPRAVNEDEKIKKLSELQRSPTKNRDAIKALEKELGWT